MRFKLGELANMHGHPSLRLTRFCGLPLHSCRLTAPGQSNRRGRPSLATPAGQGKGRAARGHACKQLQWLALQMSVMNGLPNAPKGWPTQGAPQAALAPQARAQVAAKPTRAALALALAPRARAAVAAKPPPSSLRTRRTGTRRGSMRLRGTPSRRRTSSSGPTPNVVGLSVSLRPPTPPPTPPPTKCGLLSVLDSLRPSLHQSHSPRRCGNPIRASHDRAWLCSCGRPGRGGARGRQARRG